jgi:HSP20 family protein
MALIRWNPNTDLMNLHSEMDRIFAELTESLGIAPPRQGQTGDVRQDTAFLPIDVERGDDALMIRASVPGFAPQDVDVTIDNGVLTVDAQRSKESEQREGRMLRRERFTGRFFRQVMLGEGLKENEAQATFENGVLTVRIPVARRPEPKKIPVQPSATLTASAQQPRSGGQGQKPDDSRQPATAKA